MKKRLLWSAFAMTVLVLLGFFAPLLYWRITGLVRGEAFYAGKPSCYWREAAKEEFERQFSPMPPFGSLTRTTGVAAPNQGTWCNSLEEWKHRWIGGNRNSWSRLQKDPDSLPVLRDLFHDRNPRIRAVAAVAICDLGEHAPDMIPEIIHYLIFDVDDVDLAWKIVNPIGSFESTRAVPLLCQWLDRDDKTASTATAALRNFGGHAEEAIPLLVSNMEKENHRGAASVLPYLGAKATLTLRQLLTSENVHARRHATWALAACYGDELSDRVALLVQQSVDPDVAVRRHALGALLGVPEKNAEALASLMEMLHDSDAMARITAICTIANAFENRNGPEVRGILAEFRGLAVFDRNTDVQAAAKMAIECVREQ